MIRSIRHLLGCNRPRCSQALVLSSNAIDDAGIRTLTDATAFGALANLEKLYLDNNKVGDVGLAGLASSLAAGRLVKLTFLDLSSNQICDAGMSALGQAISRGALTNLETLYVYSNRIGDTGIDTFVKCLLASTGALARLEKFYLSQNEIGDVGLLMLSEAIGKHLFLTSLRLLQLEGNPANHEIQHAALEALKKRLPKTQERGC